MNDDKVANIPTPYAANARALMDSLLSQLEKHSGGGGNGGGMEARIAKLESGVAHIERDIGEIKTDLRDVRANARTDFRTTWGALIVATLGLAGLLAHGFKWI
jgi:hypothetical protein